ncbi:HPr family phosphocarrier protein [Nocardia sp. NPDC051750]|uniref:HPr family phosphocarrier protein n=1 Tax=Nocardia sp. NPDC051750 TaxID=3364325 RepID=UPI0037BBF1BE
MYVEEFRAPGALTAEFAEELAVSAAGYSSRITLSAHEHAVNLPVLPWCWAELGIRAGTRVTITAEGGHRPPDLEDRQALDALVGRFRALTGA